MPFDGKDETENILRGEDIIKNKEFLHWAVPH